MTDFQAASSGQTFRLSAQQMLNKPPPPLQHGATWCEVLLGYKSPPSDVPSHCRASPEGLELPLTTVFKRTHHVWSSRDSCQGSESIHPCHFKQNAGNGLGTAITHCTDLASARTVEGEAGRHSVS